MISKLRYRIYRPFDLAKVQTKLFIPSMLEATRKNTTLKGQVYGLPHIWGTDGLIVNTCRVGLLHDRELLRGMATSVHVALWVSLLSVAVGTTNAFLLEQEAFPFKKALYTLALTPLVIPGVILGISILLFSNTVANAAEAARRACGSWTRASRRRPARSARRDAGPSEACRHGRRFAVHTAARDPAPSLAAPRARNRRRADVFSTLTGVSADG